MKNFRVLVWIFIGASFYALMVMTISRELVIPHFIPSAVEGHIKGDPYYYHLLALKKSKEISTAGIKRFELRPEGQGPAGVASLAYLVYASPYGIVLINAVLHGISTVVMALILFRWFPLRTSLIAITPLAISPYMIIWFSQINKDSYALAGVSLFFYGLVRILNEDKRLLPRAGFVSLLIMVAGIFLLWLVRPYINKIFFPIAAMIFAASIIFRVARSQQQLKEFLAFAIYGVLVLASLAMLSSGAVSDETIDSLYSYNHVKKTEINTEKSNTVFSNCLERIDGSIWRSSDLLPDVFDKNLKAIIGHRCLIFSILNTDDNPTTRSSFVDMDILPSGSFEALSYFPRAALLGVFSPWPEKWGYVFKNGPSFFYTIASLEAIILYVGLGGCVCWLWSARRWSILIPVLMSVCVMSIYGLATPFLGALYRYRYPWWMVIICIGVAATYEAMRGKTHEQS